MIRLTMNITPYTQVEGQSFEQVLLGWRTDDVCVCMWVAYVCVSACVSGCPWHINYRQARTRCSFSSSS